MKYSSEVLTGTAIPQSIHAVDCAVDVRSFRRTALRFIKLARGCRVWGKMYRRKISGTSFPFNCEDVSMRQLFLATVLLATFSVCADEESKVLKSTPEQRAGFQSQYMTEHLGLSPDLAAKVQGINLKYAQQMDPILKGAGGKLDKIQKSRSVMAAKDKELQGVLTPAQFEQYDGMKDEMKSALESSLSQ
jgi:hypothetical protein